MARAEKRGMSIWSALGATVVSAAALGYWFKVRPWHLTYGATPEEADAPFPGDDLVTTPATVATHAITIEAPVESVWPWVTQLGQEHGGAMKTAVMEPERLFVLTSEGEDGLEPAGSWTFSLVPLSPIRSRLVVRARWRAQGLGQRLGLHLWREPAHFVKERALLQEIKRRAEAPPLGE